MGKINLLSLEVANLIAAGEVVDRPASVIKELVENSIDSGATRVTVEIQRGGVLFMRVSDNGCGMTPDDLPVAVKRHATSKIHAAADLDGITTLGFRGEALAAICSVSDVRIISKTKDAEMGAIFEVHSGREGSVSERGASNGTTVIVENLFANVPARLKFLKRDQTEAMAVCSVTEKIALSHPEIAFRLISDGVSRLETVGDGNLYGVIRAVYGREFAKATLKVDDSRDGIRVSGYITSPDAPRSNRNYQNFFINGRYVKTKTATAAIEQAYTSYIPPEKFPGCVLCIDISPQAVDVNVHPAKLEVKFSNERPVFDGVYAAVRNALTSNSERPSMTDERGSRTDGKVSQQPFGVSQANFGAPQVPRFSTAFVPVNDRVAAGSPAAVQLGISMPSTQAGQYPPRRTLPPRAPENAAEYRDMLRSRPQISYGKTENDEYAEYDKNADAEVPVPPAFVCDPHRDAELEAEAEARAKADEAAEDARAYRIVGELFNTYIIVERKSGVLFIDKHAAHERLIFEKMKKISEGEKRATQMMMIPVDVILMSDEVALLEEYRHEIEESGFSFGSSRNKVSVSELPMGIEVETVGAIFEGFAAELKSGAGSIGESRDAAFERALYQASCKAAIKGGRVYPGDYAEWLVSELYDRPDITYCPHGRPIAIEMGRHELDRKFKRE